MDGSTLDTLGLDAFPLDANGATSPVAVAAPWDSAVTATSPRPPAANACVTRPSPRPPRTDVRANTATRISCRRPAGPAGWNPVAPARPAGPKLDGWVRQAQDPYGWMFDPITPSVNLWASADISGP